MATPASIGSSPSHEPERLPGQELLSTGMPDASHLTLIYDAEAEGLSGNELPGAEEEAAEAIPDSSVALGATELLTRARRISYFVSTRIQLLGDMKWVKDDGHAIGIGRMMDAHEQQLTVHQRSLEAHPDAGILSLAAMLIGSGAVAKGSEKA